MFEEHCCIPFWFFPMHFHSNIHCMNRDCYDFRFSPSRKLICSFLRLMGFCMQGANAMTEFQGDKIVYAKGEKKAKMEQD